MVLYGPSGGPFCPALASWSGANCVDQITCQLFANQVQKCSTRGPRQGESSARLLMVRRAESQYFKTVGVHYCLAADSQEQPRDNASIRHMVFGSSVVWRYPQERDGFSICDGLQLDNGFIVYADPEHNIKVLESTFYTPVCYENGPVLSTYKSLGIPQLPTAHAQWNKFLDTESGSFKYSVYPIIYSITVSTMVCIFMTLIVFTNHTQRPSWLLRVGSFLASVNLIVLFARAIMEFSRQHSLGFASGEELLDSLQSDSVFSGIDFVFVLIAQFSQVQVIMRLFSRVKEKRVGFILGGTLSVCAQVIWGVSTFSTFDEFSESDITILPAFTYLLRIALSMMYCGLVIIYGIGKRRYIFHRDIILLTILTFITVNFQFAFFVADIADVWVSELSEIFNTTIYVSVTVIPWEWINRVHALERHQQTEGILGRPVYEDEYKEIARYEVITDKDNDHHQDDPDHPGTTSPTPVLQSGNTPLEVVSQKLRKRVKDSFAQTSDALMYFTDQVIAYGLAVPRSVSANSSTKIADLRMKNPLNTARKEVFIYSKKEVVCDSDNELSDRRTNDSTATSFEDLAEGTSRDRDP